MMNWKQRVASVLNKPKRRNLSRLRNLQTESLETRILPATFVVSAPAEDADFGPELEISFDGSSHTVSLTGTDANDFIIVGLQVRNSLRITLNQTNYVFPPEVLTNPKVLIDGQDGFDQLKIHLGSGNGHGGWSNIVNMSPGSLTIPEAGGNFLESVDTEYQTVIGSALSDQVAFKDSASDDTFVGRYSEGTAWMQGPGFTNVARGANGFVAESTGGADSSSIYIDYTPRGIRYRTLENSLHVGVAVVGVSFDVHNFRETSTTFQRSGGVVGSNVTRLNNHVDFEASNGTSSFRTDDYHHTTSGLQRINASSGTGSGTAILHDTAGDDFANLIFNQASIGTSSDRRTDYAVASGFNIVTVNASTGHDTVSWLDSYGDDRVVSTKDYAVMRAGVYYAKVDGFDVVNLNSSRAGNDIVQFVDSAGDDYFAVGALMTADRQPQPGEPLQSDAATMFHDYNASDGTRTIARGFSEVTAIGTMGGQNDIGWFSPLGFSLRRVGAWNIQSHQ